PRNRMVSPPFWDVIDPQLRQIGRTLKYWLNPGDPVTTALLRLLSVAFVTVVFVASGIFTTASSAEAAGATGTLTVQLVTPAGAAWKVEGVGVSMLSTNKPFNKSANTNKSGIANLSGIPAGAEVTVQAKTWDNHYEYTPTIKVVTVGSGQKLSTKLIVARGGVVEGTVTVATGALKYANVAAIDGAGNPVATTTTDAKGFYSLRGLKTGSYAIQFNARNFINNTSPNVSTYGWAYYTTSASSSASLAGAKRIAVKQAGATSTTSVASVSKNVSGKVVAGPGAKFALATSGTGGQLNIEKISAKKTIVAETVYAQLYAPGTAATVRLNAGTYRLTVEYKIGTATVQYFYTGANKPLSKDRTKAVLFTVGTSGNVSVKVGKRP
ncbi:MAG: Carboxypeptidase regulatory-like domain, partial [Glaciihabitans sp.]|nr:Carboxypeptidase regulatory-like domain [Glaciihabitans sp.]